MTVATHHISITLTYGDLSIHAGAHVDHYSGEQYSDMANRATAALVNAYEVLSMTSHRLAAEHTDASQAE